MKYVLRAKFDEDRFKYARENNFFIKKFYSQKDAFAFLKENKLEEDGLKWECITSYAFERDLKKNPVGW